MKIVQFLASKGVGGLENIFVDLCNVLVKTERLEVIVFKGASSIEKLDKNIIIHELSSNPSRFNIILYVELYRLMYKIQPDIIHTHAGKATQIFYYLNKVLDLPYIATKHNIRKSKIFNKVPCVIAVSKYVKESIENNNIKVIYNGVHTPEVNVEYKNEIFTIISVGRLDKVKGFDTLIKACNTLDFPYVLQIIGEGQQREYLENIIKILQLQNKVTLLGFKSNVNEYLNACDIQVIASESEGFSLTMAEGVFYAPILLSTKVGACVEILPNELLYNIENLTEKISDVYNNKEKYINYFSKTKKKYKDKLTIERCALEHIDLYRQRIKKLN